MSEKETTKKSPKVAVKTQKTEKKPTGKQAVIKMGGKQYIVHVGDELLIEKIDAKEKAKFDIQEVLAVIDGDVAEVGTPTVKNKVTAEVVEHGKGEKIYVVKYKPKVRYRRKTGHRQHYTKIKITSIS